MIEDVQLVSNLSYNYRRFIVSYKRILAAEHACEEIWTDSTTFITA